MWRPWPGKYSVDVYKVRIGSYTMPWPFYTLILRFDLGIQFIITAKNLPGDSAYLNLRLRMEQQRLFAWSETSGLLDLENAKETKITGIPFFIS